MYSLFIYRTLASDEDRKRQMREDIVKMNTLPVRTVYNSDYYIEARCSLCGQGNNRYYAYFEREICQDDDVWCHNCTTIRTQSAFVFDEFT